MLQLRPEFRRGPAAHGCSKRRSVFYQYSETVPVTSLSIEPAEPPSDQRRWACFCKCRPFSLIIFSMNIFIQFKAIKVMKTGRGARLTIGSCRLSNPCSVCGFFAIFCFSPKFFAGSVGNSPAHGWPMCWHRWQASAQFAALHPHGRLCSVLCSSLFFLNFPRQRRLVANIEFDG